MKVKASEQILRRVEEKAAAADFLFTLSKSCSMTLVFGVCVCVSIDENSSLIHFGFCYFFCSSLFDTALRRLLPPLSAGAGSKHCNAFCSNKEKSSYICKGP